MKQFYSNSLLSLLLMMCPAASFAEKAQIDAIILANQACQNAYEKSKQANDDKTQQNRATGKKDDQPYVGKSIEADMFQLLLKRHSVSLAGALDETPRKTLKKKILQTCEKDKAEICARRNEYPLDVRFAKEADTLRVRQSLLRLFQALQSDARETDWVSARLTSVGQTLGTVKDSDYEGDADKEWLEAFLNHVGDKDNSAKLPITITCKTPPEPNAIANVTTDIVTQIDRSIVPKNQTDNDATWKFRIAKDPTQFSASKPESASLGTQIAGTGENRELKTDIAAGFVLNLDSNSLKKQPWNAACTEGQDCLRGSKRSVATYLSYTQAPAKETVFDPSGALLDDGTPLTKEQEFASGRFSIGMRLDYEFFRGFIPPGSDEDEYFNELIGRRRPEHKVSVTAETFTDNFLDLQGSRAEMSYQPPGHWLLDPPGYRRRSLLLDNSLSATLMWDAQLVGDLVTYARQPRNRDVTVDAERLSLEEFARIGFNFDVTLAGRRPFSYTKDPAWWELKFEHQKRESLGGRAADAATDEVTLKLKDILNENWDLGITYHNGRDLVDLQNQEYWAIEISAKR